MTLDVLERDSARLWNYGPDWSAGFNVRRAWRTDIFGSRNNTEQRRALRTKPRLSLDYRTIAQGEDLESLSRNLRGAQNRPAIVPDFARWARLTASSNDGDSTLTVSPLPVWAAEGQTLLLCGADGVERVEVESAAGSTITLVDPLAVDWPSGAVLRPTFFGLLNGRLSTSRRTRGVAEATIALEAYPGGTPPRDEGTPWDTFNDREVFTLEPDYSSPPSVAALWPVEDVDAESGWTAQFRPVDRAERLVEAEFRGLDVETATQLEQFFDRMKGMRGAFFMPTCERDFLLAGTVTAGSSNLFVNNSTLAADFGAVNFADVETAIVATMLDGSRIYRRVQDIFASTFQSVVQVTSPWPVELSTATLARLSWMPIYRFASDEMTMTWQTPLRARTRLSFQSVKR